MFLQSAAVYFAAEMCGAVLGFALLKWTTSTDDSGFCVTAVHPELTEAQGVIIEFIATALLILVCCACWDPRNAHNSDSLPLKFGFAVGALAITFVRICFRLKIWRLNRIIIN